MTEVVVFIAFVAIAGAHHRLKHAIECNGFENHPMLKKLNHPTVLDTVKDYGIHIVIYSGYVINSHPL